jgi:prophage antirepressor-like protein
MSDYMLASGPQRDPSAHQLYEKDFLGRRIRVAIPDGGEPKLLFDDVIEVLGPDSFGPNLSGLYRRTGIDIQVAASDGLVWVKALTERDLIHVMLLTTNPAGDQFRSWAVDVLHAVQRTGRYGPPENVPAPYPDDPIIAMRIQQLEAERRLSAIERRAESIEQKTDTIKQLAQASFDASRNKTEYYALLAWCNLHRRQFPVSILNREGTTLSGHCRQMGILLGHVHDERYGKVNTYPRHVLEEWWPRFLRRMGAA